MRPNSSSLGEATGLVVDRQRERVRQFERLERMEQINRELGTTTQDLALPIRRLIADGVIRVKGQTEAVDDLRCVGERPELTAGWRRLN